MTRDSFVIAQLSDLHCGSPYFDEALLVAAVNEICGLQPDLVIVAGDLTAEGYAGEFRIAETYLAPIFEAGLTAVVIPGNHDTKNVGYLHFRDTFGPGDVHGKADRVLDLTLQPAGSSPANVLVVALDTTKPDLAEGEIGRERYEWIRRSLAAPADLRIVAMHHHLVPIPGTGRERNTVWDAGDVLALLTELDVDIVLCGHKHVPFVWLLNGVLVVNSGTVSSHRVRGYVQPSFNILEVTSSHITVTLRFPGTGEQVAAVLDRSQPRLDAGEGLAGMFTRSTWHG